MSDRPPDDPPTRDAGGDPARGERAVVRASALLAATTWCGSGALIAAQATHTIHLQPERFGLLCCWSIGAGCLGLGIAMLHGEEPRVTRVLTRGLAIGDPRLDSVLIPGARRWRLRPHVRKGLTSSAAVAWVLASIYTWQAAKGMYHVALPVSMFTLILFLSVGIWTTVIVASGTAAARRETLYEIACEMHAHARQERARLRHTARGAGDLAAPAELHLVQGSQRTRERRATQDEESEPRSGRG